MEIMLSVGHSTNGYSSIIKNLVLNTPSVLIPAIVTLAFNIVIVIYEIIEKYVNHF